MTRNIKVHDGIIGVLLLGTTALALLVDARFGWLTAATGAIMLQSAFTGFCPVHWTVNRVLPERR